MQDPTINNQHVLHNGDLQEENNSTSEEGEGLVNRTEKVLKRKTRSQEAVAALLSAYDEDYSAEFAQEGVEFRDLSSLSAEDLNLFGVGDHGQVNEMLDNFASLPNQNKHYDEVLNAEESKEYNNKILSTTNTHLESLNTSLSAANFKLQINPSTDVVVDEAEFASRYVLKALDELKRVTSELEHHIQSLDKKINGQSKSNTSKNKIISLFSLLFLASGITTVFWYWKRR